MGGSRRRRTRWAELTSLLSTVDIVVLTNQTAFHNDVSMTFSLPERKRPQGCAE